MKRTMAAMGLVFTVAASQAAPVDKPIEKLQKEIRKSVSYPDFAKTDKMEGLVLVEYHVANDGSINVMKMNASDPKLASYVKQQLEKVQVTQIQLQGKHCAKFTFKYVEH